MFLQCQYRSLSGAPVPLYSVLGNHLLPPVRKISFLSMVIPGSNAEAWKNGENVGDTPTPLVNTFARRYDSK